MQHYGAHVASSLAISRRCIFVVAMLCFLSGAEQGAEASQGGVPPAERLYEGRSLPEWRTIIKSLDPEDPAASSFVPGLHAIIRDDDGLWYSRRQAALTLGRIGAPARDVVPTLLGILNSEEAESRTTRLWCVQALALFGPVAAPAASTLAEYVADPGEWHVLRLASIEALGRIGATSPIVFPALHETLRPTVPAIDQQHRQELRMAAAEGLALLGAAAAPAIPELLRAARADWDLLRLSAVTTLGAIGPSGDVAVTGLVDVMLFDEAPEVADAAAVSLGNVGPAAEPALRQLLTDPDVATRERAVLGLKTMGRSGAETLSAALDDSEAMVRCRAAVALLEFEEYDARSVPLLVDLLTDPDRGVRITAYRALRGVPSRLEPVSDRLEELAAEGEGDARVAARQLLILMRREG